MAKTLKQMGFPGVDLTTRPRGHVLPENVARDLPRAHDALRRRGRFDTDDYDRVAVSKRPGGAPDALHPRQSWASPSSSSATTSSKDVAKLDSYLAQVKSDVEGLAAIAQHAGIAGGFHNHSGAYVGSALWGPLGGFCATPTPQPWAFTTIPAPLRSRAAKQAGRSAFTVSAQTSRWWLARISSGKKRAASGRRGCVRWGRDGRLPQVLPSAQGRRLRRAISLHVEYTDRGRDRSATDREGNGRNRTRLPLPEGAARRPCSELESAGRLL